MRAFVIFLICSTFCVFAMPVFALQVTPEGGEPFQLEILGTEEATSSSEEVVPVETLDSSELPQVRLTPLSPFYFLKTLWENVCWFIRRSPEERASLALELAEKRLGEALQISEKKKFSLIERLFAERKVLLKRAWDQVGQIGGDDARKEKVEEAISRQLALGSEALFQIRATLSDEEASRAANLSAWRDLWVAKLEEGLGPPQLQEATLEVSRLATSSPAGGSPSASLGEPRQKRARSVSFFESVFNFLLGPRRALLSPLAAPERD